MRPRQGLSLEKYLSIKILATINRLEKTLTNIVDDWCFVSWAWAWVSFIRAIGNVLIGILILDDRCQTLHANLIGNRIAVRCLLITTPYKLEWNWSISLINSAGIDNQRWAWRVQGPLSGHGVACSCLVPRPCVLIKCPAFREMWTSHVFGKLIRA